MLITSVPAPLPPPSEDVNLTLEHRQQMRTKLYGARGAKHVDARTNFDYSRYPYADEAPETWKSVTREQYSQKKIEFSSQRHDAAKDGRATHFSIQDFRVNPGEARSSVTKVDYGSYPYMKPSRARKTESKYPVLLTTSEENQVQSTYRGDFAGKSAKMIRFEDKIGMRSSHFVLGDDVDGERFQTATSTTLASVPKDAYGNVLEERQNATYKKEMYKKSNVMDYPDTKLDAWKTVNQTEYGSPDPKSGVYEKHDEQIEKFKANLKSTHLRLGTSNEFDKNSKSAYVDDFRGELAARVKSIRTADNHPSLSLCWLDDCAQGKFESLSKATYQPPSIQSDAREIARKIKEINMKDGFELEYAGAPKLSEIFTTNNRSQFTAPHKESNQDRKSNKKEEKHLDFLKENDNFEGQSKTKTDYLDPLKRDPELMEKYRQHLSNFNDISTFFRHSSIVLGTDEGLTGTNYADTIGAYMPFEKQVKTKPTHFNNAAENSFGLISDERKFVGSTVYSETFLGQKSQRLPKMPGPPSEISLHHTSPLSSADYISTAHRTFVPPEVMIDRNKTFTSRAAE